MHSDSVDHVAGRRPLPAMVIVSDRCTLMIGEDQQEGRLRDAASNIRFYAYPRLPAVQYGRVPGIPAYAASGTKLQFMYIQTDGQVRYEHTSHVGSLPDHDWTQGSTLAVPFLA